MALVSAHDVAIGQPNKNLGKFCELNSAKDIAIRNTSPDTQRLTQPLFDSLNIVIGDKIGHRCVGDKVVSRAEHSATYPSEILRGREGKVWRNWNWQDGGIRPIGNIVSRCLARVNDQRSSLKSDIFVPFLKRGGPDNNRHVGSQLTPRSDFCAAYQVAGGDKQECCGESENYSRDSGDPMWVAEYVEYAGSRFNKEYVQRGALIFLGIVGAIVGGIYYARRRR